MGKVLKVPVLIPFKDIDEIDFKKLFSCYDNIVIKEENGDLGKVTYIEIISIRE